MITTLFIMLVLHFIGDFPLQGQYLAENKGKDDYLLFAHSMIWTGLLSAGLLFAGVYAPWKVIFLLMGHFAIDRIKARGFLNTWFSANQALLLDQFVHFMQILVTIIF